MLIILIFILFIALVVGLLLIIFSILKKRKQEQEKINWFSRMRFVVLRILVPKNNEKTPQAAEQMFAALHGIFKVHELYQEYISFEIAAKDKFLQFYVCTPTHLKDFVQSQIYAQYPNAEIVEVDDYTLSDEERIKNGHLKIAGTEVGLTNESFYPIKTFLNFEVDPLAAITGVMSKVEKDEQVWIQILVKPLSDGWHKESSAFVKKIKAGGGGTNLGSEVIGLIGRAIHGVISTIITGVTPPSSKAEEKDDKGPSLSSAEEAGITGIETKATKLGFSTKIRILALAENENLAQSKITSLLGAFKQYNILNMNGFVSGDLKADIGFWQDFSNRSFLDDGYIFNIEELASIFHLPSISVQTPNIVWAGSKKGEPPSNLPIEENVAEEDLTIYAKTDFRHFCHKFGIKVPDRRYHMYAIGKTGTGKSTMLENMAIDDIREGRGLAVVDPHGDLINHIMDYIPEERIKDVVLFSPSDKLYPVAFNPLENVDPDLKSIVASGVVGIFKKIFGESWGPRLEYILRNTVLALLDYPNATMLGITRLLVDKDFRNKVVSNISDPVIKDFFVNEFEQYDPKFRTEAIAPIQNKVGQFLSSATIRNIVGQPKSTIDIKKIMDTGKILLVNLSIGEIGEDASSLLGSLMITKIQLAAMQRATMIEEERRDFYLYVDEFQNFATDSFAVILSEARKYHLNLIMTNQYVAQMPETVRDAVFGNVGTLISYRIGAPDAELLAREFAPVFEANDLVNLDNYHIYIKMSIDGVTSPAFSAITLPRSAKKFENQKAILDSSRRLYSRQRDYVEAQIGEISALPKVEEILTKAEKNLLPKVPPKIGETYYREIQAPGDIRWYFGGGTSDEPLNEEVVQEKIKKAEEKAKEFEERHGAEKEELDQWQKDRLKALEPEKLEKLAEKSNTPEKPDQPVNNFATHYQEKDDQNQTDTATESNNNPAGSSLSSTSDKTVKDTQTLEEGKTIKIE